MNEKRPIMQTVSKQRSEVVRGTEKGLPYCPRSRVTVSNDHFCDYATGLILLAATSQKWHWQLLVSWQNKNLTIFKWVIVSKCQCAYSKKEKNIKMLIFFNAPKVMKVILSVFGLRTQIGNRWSSWLILVWLNCAMQLSWWPLLWGFLITYKPKTQFLQESLLQKYQA